MDAPLGESFRILVVDDEVELQRSIQKYLMFQSEFPNLEVMGAGSFADGLEKAESFRPLVILQDINLPDGNGLQLIRQIKRTYPVIQCIVITGASDFERVLDAMAFGAADYLKKPLDMEILSLVVRNAMERCQRWGGLLQEEYNAGTQEEEA
ncbi:MAG: response regulator [Magnetococcales bacterium]|nr:response regulator [Magnetococcales bacterium]